TARWAARRRDYGWRSMVIVRIRVGGGPADDDVELRRQLADRRSGDRRKFGLDELAFEQIGHVMEDAIAGIARRAGDEDLAGQQLAAVLFDLVVDVPRRPARIGDGLDGSEAVLAGRGGGEAA